MNSGGKKVKKGRDGITSIGKEDSARKGDNSTHLGVTQGNLKRLVKT